MTEPTANYEVQAETNREVASRSLMEQLTEEAIQEVEEEQALQRKSAVSVFRSMLNQPALVSISSANANSTGISESFSEFSVDLPRPILKVDTVQLLNANIPECTQNIPNTACAFWYYRLNPYYGYVPNSLNLYMVRLLPSYYKPEFSVGTTYGFNQTFFGYDEVADQLAKSTVRDLAYDNVSTLTELGEADIPTPPNYLPEVPYSQNDIDIAFNIEQNKFQMTGLNSKLPLISYYLPSLSTNSYVLPFDVAVTYGLGEFVQYGAPTKVLYKSKVAGNIGNFPVVTPNAFWEVSTGDIGYSASTTYALGDFATSGEVVYRSLQASNLNNTPLTSPTYWAYISNDSRFVSTWSATTFYAVGTIVYNPLTYSFWICKLANLVAFSPAIGSPYFDQYVPPTDSIYNRYLVAGYDDPNVAIRQGIQKKTWNPYNTFFAGNSSATLHNGVAFIPASSQNSGVLVNTIPFQYPLTWDDLNFYKKGDLVLYLGLYYVAIADSFDDAPIVGDPDDSYWRLRTLTYSATTSYITGDVVVYSGNSYIALQNSKGQLPQTTAGNVNVYWQTNYWVRDYEFNDAADSGLHSISSEYDMIDYFPSADYWTYPFPAGIPGQPFNSNPKRLLNSILGFTWNGVMDVRVFDGFEMFDRLANNTVVQLYNRVRPVPQYQVSFFSTESVGVSENAVENPTFTANGYANLVYTSVVAIYGSIAGARTLDTQRNTSLLGMTSMNADNLGVSFYGNYIDSELIANEEDLYNVSIQLYDEFNEPFVLTNNAVVTLTFKMTYKNK